MRKILIVINSLNIGGSERSLVSLLNLLDYSKNSVDILMFRRGGEFDKFIPREVNILNEPDYYQFLLKRKKVSFPSKIKYSKCRILTSLALRKNYRSKKSVNNEQILYKYQKHALNNIGTKYDVAIAYSQGLPTYFVGDKVQARKKIGWINCDYATTMYDKEFDSRFYTNIDKIVAVSDTIKKSIISLKPEYNKKIEVILDIVNPTLINEMANDKNGFKKDDKNLIILTVARLVIHHKGYDLAVKAASLLKKNKIKFKWYVIGTGPDEDKILSLIKKYEVEDVFILLGKKDNPYPYMKTCDLYVQPSKKEGFGLTVIEAKILEKPIVCTNFNTSAELINNTIDGLIVDLDEQKIYEAICRYINDPYLKNKILNNLNTQLKYSSIKELDKINKILD